MGKSSLNNTMSDTQFWPNKISWCLKPFCNRLYSHDNKIIYDNNNIKKNNYKDNTNNFIE